MRQGGAANSRTASQIAYAETSPSRAHQCAQDGKPLLASKCGKCGGGLSRINLLLDIYFHISRNIKIKLKCNPERRFFFK